VASLFEKISEELKVALKDKDEIKVSTLRFLISKINNSKIDKGRDLTDEEVISEVEKDAKRHKESIEAFEKGGRDELASKEKKELEILSSYLPEQMTREEVEKIISDVINELGAVSLVDMGKVMSVVMGKIKGKTDGALVSEVVKEKLSRVA